MKTAVKKLYEAMFLVDSAEAAADWEGVNKTIKKILKRADADVISIRKWEDRRLAYGIGGKDRGLYILCYFRAEGDKIRDIERDVQLSEQVIRVLILCAEHMTEEDIEKDTPIMRAEKYAERVAAAAAERAKARRSQKAAVDEPEGAEEPEQPQTEDVSEQDGQADVRESEQ